jgi:lipopolysaccharide transport system permease protein
MSTSEPLVATSESWVIEPRAQELTARGREVWQYRRLLRFFAIKSLQKLYGRTVLGWAWLFIRPLFPLVVKTLVFGGVLNVGSDGVPYFMFLVIGQSIWELFAGCTFWGTRSLELNRGLIARIYVPRLILPVAMMSPPYLTFVIHLGVVAVALVYYRVTDGVFYVGNPSGLAAALLATGLTTLLALGISLWLSVPALRARDVRFTLNYVLSFWIFLTPVMFPLSTAPAAWQRWLAINPMTAYTLMFRSAFIPSAFPETEAIVLALSITAAVLLSGLWYFNRAESDAADKV